MGKSNKYTVSECPGSQRKSPRNYSHAIIGVRDYSKMIKIEESAERFEYYKSVWHRASQRLATVKVGAPEHGTSGYVYTQQKCYSDIQLTTEYITAESYAVFKSEERLQQLHDLMEKNQPEVLQWSMSYSNAANKVGYWAKFYLNVRVVETKILN